MGHAGSIEIVIWGRGGQGAKTAGDLLTLSLYRAGENPQGQPRYSADRMGAPVVYAIRYNTDRSRVWDRSWIDEPDFIVLFDLTLLLERDLAASWSLGATVIANARPGDPLLSRIQPFQTAVVDANRIARECGLMKGSVPALSSVMPGAFASASGLIPLMTIENTLPEVRGPLSRYPEPNLRALRCGFAETVFLDGARPGDHAVNSGDHARGGIRPGTAA